MTEARDQVLSMRFSPVSFIVVIRCIRRSWTKGAFLADRVTVLFYLPFPARLTMYFVEGFFLLRVLCPKVGTPHGVTGLRPGGVEPSPPPCGWSTGFMVVPRTPGRIPLQRLRPALPVVRFS